LRAACLAILDTVSTGAFGFGPLSKESEMPSPSLSVSYGSERVVPSVFGGVKPPFVELGMPFASTVPS
jgi:hypothetical protein